MTNSICERQIVREGQDFGAVISIDDCVELFYCNNS